MGFATTSSEAALPLAMERMEEFGVPRWIVSFVIPTGYSFNMTGSSIYLSMAALFAAQAAGLHLSVGQQIVLLATLVLTSKGIAGVPRATLVVLLAVGRFVPDSRHRRADAAGRRHADGHGPHRSERHRQLHGRGRCCALGRRTETAPTRTEFNKTDALRHPLGRRNCSHRCCHLGRPGPQQKHSRDPERYVLRHDLHDVNVALLCDHHPVWHQQGSGSARRSTPARPRPAPPASAAAAACKSSVARPTSSACPVAHW